MLPCRSCRPPAPTGGRGWPSVGHGLAAGRPFLPCGRRLSAGGNRAPEMPLPPAKAFRASRRGAAAFAGLFFSGKTLTLGESQLGSFATSLMLASCPTLSPLVHGVIAELGHILSFGIIFQSVRRSGKEEEDDDDNVDSKINIRMQKNHGHPAAARVYYRPACCLGPAHKPFRRGQRAG